MNDSLDSNTQGETSGRRRRVWRLIPEILSVLVGLAAIHAFQTRHLLDSGGTPAPPLELPVLDGGTVDLRSSQTTTLVYFFAPWCHVCAASAHNLRALRRSQEDDELTMLLVALDWQDVQEVRDYAERHALDVPVLLGDAKTAADWQVVGYPTYYVVDGGHRIARRDFGYSTEFGLWWRTRFAD